ncbi:MAG: type II secretion system protein [Planctomycetota bacterium]|nr:type II secretion system protein [Planctomycetota bacterium]
MRSNRLKFESRSIRKTGFTLVELLVVIAIMLILVGVAIPTIRLLTKGDKVREAARGVNVFIESAQKEAMVEGFAGIWLERDQGGNKVTRIFKIRRPPKYSGDFADATCYVQPVPDTSDDDNDGNTTEFSTTRFNAYFLQNENSLFGPTASGKIPIQVNDRIQLGGSGPWYQILDLPTAVAHPVSNSPAYRVPVSLNTLTYDSSNNYSGVSFNNYLVPLEGEVSFQVERAPKISTRDELELPKGTFIDLQHSGFAVDPNANQSALFDGESLGGNEFSNFDSGNGSTPAPAAVEKIFPVVIMFRKDGSVDRVDYQVYPTQAASPQEFVPTSQFPRTNIYLLVASEPESLDPNHSSLTDLDNQWIVISRTNGTVSTADVRTPDGATPGEARAASRRKAREGQNLTAN